MTFKKLMFKGVWSPKDLYEFLTEFKDIKVGQNRCREIIKTARTDFGGQTPIKRTYAKRDAILAVLGMNLEEELTNYESIYEAEAGNVQDQR